MNEFSAKSLKRGPENFFLVRNKKEALKWQNFAKVTENRSEHILQLFERQDIELFVVVLQKI
jgi:hypothetical protein